MFGVENRSCFRDKYDSHHKNRWLKHGSDQQINQIHSSVSNKGQPDVFIQSEDLELDFPALYLWCCSCPRPPVKSLGEMVISRDGTFRSVAVRWPMVVVSDPSSNKTHVSKPVRHWATHHRSQTNQHLQCISTDVQTSKSSAQPDPDYFCLWPLPDLTLCILNPGWRYAFASGLLLCVCSLRTILALPRKTPKQLKTTVFPVF